MMSMTRLAQQGHHQPRGRSHDDQNEQQREQSSPRPHAVVLASEWHKRPLVCSLSSTTPPNVSLQGQGAPQGRFLAHSSHWTAVGHFCESFAKATVNLLWVRNPRWSKFFADRGLPPR